MIYLIPLILILVGVFFCDFLKKKKYSRILIFVIFTCLALISGFSYRLGSDVIHYMHEYTYYDNNLQSAFNLSYLTSFNGRMPGWVFITTVLKSFRADFVVFKLFHAIVINFIIVFFLKKYATNIFTALLFYFFSSYITFNFEVLRESLAVSVFLLSVPMLLRKKFISYYIYVFVAILFHESALIVAFIPLFFLISLTKRNAIAIIIIFSVLLFAKTSVSVAIMDTTSSVFFLRGKAQLYFENERYSSQAEIGFVGFLIFLFKIIFVLYSIYVVNKYKLSRNKYMMNVLLFSVCIVYLSYFIQIFYRSSNYIVFIYICFVTSTLPLLFNLYLQRPLSSILYRLILVFFLSLRIYNLFIPIYGTNYPSYIRYYPYYSVFDKQVDNLREQYYMLNL